MAGKEDGECRECDSIAKIMEGGVCKAEFMKFDACMDNALIQKTDDSACEKMVRSRCVHAFPLLL